MLALDMLRGAAGAQPTLDLNFTSGTLDSRVTYSGASLATLTDATGAIAYKPHNLALYSDDLTATGWASGTATAAPGTSRTGGNSTRVQLLSGESRYRNCFPGSTISITSSIGCWIKSNTGANQTVRLTNTHSGVVNWFSPDLTVTTTWQFFSFSQVFGASAGTGTILAGVTTNASGTAADILVGEFQCNLGPLQPYYPTTSAAYYGPRFTYDPVTHAALGLLIEEQRTNLLLQSGNVGGASWTTSGALTVTQNAVAGPMGGITATRIQTSGAASVYQNFTVAASTAYTFTFYALNNGGTLAQYSVYDVSHAANIFAETTYLPSINGSTWTRVTVSFTTPAGCVSVNVYPIRATGSGADLYLDCAQLEAGAFATSYIPTTSASVTRAADSATMTGSNFSSWFNATQGTFVAEVTSSNLNTVEEAIAVAMMNSNNFIGIGRNYGGGSPTGIVLWVNNSSVSQAYIVAGTVSAGTKYKVAASYAANAFAECVNSGTVGTDVSGTVPASLNTLKIGQTHNGIYANSVIARLRYYPVALTNAQLQALTT